MEKAKNVDEYIAGFDPAIQQMMQQLRELVKQSAPQAQETISYGMPAFKLNGPLLYFAAHTKHLGFYPAGTSTVDVFKKAGFEVTKGSVHFYYGQPLPDDLIKDMVKFRVQENLARKKKK
ncbi:MAG TPA: DUF1801 domain-containing protein [Lentimicrobium sp.]|nr:DUF1801 domain-containing protein [Lentimicrobium sp.]